VAKSREATPKATRELVLSEFNHRCAICGADRPQLHHIDENPSNNDPQNLIPLCPNHHLTDQHNPTRSVDRDKLRLFRTHKDPVILWPQFHPLFIRMRFLEEAHSDPSSGAFDKDINELIDFVQELEMGSFYSKKLRSVLPKQPIHHPPMIVPDAPRDPVEEAQWREMNVRAWDHYRSSVAEARDQAYALIIELLRYQRWERPTGGR
jgi:hypothetical protein